MSEPWKSRATQFEEVYRKDVEAELARLDKGSIEIVLKMLDLELLLLGPQALLEPDRAESFSGAAHALHGVMTRLREVHTPPAASTAKPEEEEYEDG